ncbi:uncharacterized protein VTP21DRAFT_6442 [Calcarisporiella thermophila]|uniref:uncharacterized protein n=1 Tax=Calcarisporiella thermophila TaxID=911321 RepID=UPI00374231C6
MSNYVSSSDFKTDLESGSSLPFRARSTRLTVEVPVAPSHPQPSSPHAISSPHLTSPGRSSPLLGRAPSGSFLPHSPVRPKRRPLSGTVAGYVRDFLNWPLNSSLLTPTHSPSSSGKRWWLSRAFRMGIFLVTAFSVLLTTAHLFRWMAVGSLDKRHVALVQTPKFELKRTYDPDMPYSVLSEFTTKYRLSKMFSMELPDTLSHVDPYYLRSAVRPDPESVTLLMILDENGLDDLPQMAKSWGGPISATIAISTDTKNSLPKLSAKEFALLKRIRELHQSEPVLKRSTDIHIIFESIPYKPMQPRRNLHRNLARLFSRTDYIADFAPNTWPVTDIQEALQLPMYLDRLKDGDVLVIPTFAYRANSTAREVPYSKGAALRLAEAGELTLFDRSWEAGTGPTGYNTWRNENQLYKVDDFELHYEPSVIMSKSQLPWCPEKFKDNRASCLYGAYLSGAEFYVMPEDFLIQKPGTPEHPGDESLFEKLFGERLYLKYQQEQCLRHAGRFVSLGLWNTPRSQHCKVQCANVLRAWGKGILS